MAKTQQVPQQDLSTPAPDAGGAAQMASPLWSMATTLGNSAMMGMMAMPFNPLVGALTGAAVGAVTGAAATTKQYVDMSEKEKTTALVGVMDQSRGVLDANGVSEHTEAQLAGIMGNEGSRNLRRKALGDNFVTEAKGLKGKLSGVDLDAMKADPEKLKKFTAGLSEDQRHLFDQVNSGSLNLASLDSKDPAVRGAVVQQITETGISVRANQYDEMQQLMARKKEGPLSQPEQTRLTALQNMGGSKKIGMGGKMGDLAGMCKDRFAEIYAEGQQRFEPAQYKALKASYEKNLKTQKKPGDPVTMASGIGSFKMDATAQGQLATNDDLIADMATSYGTAQIMGAYAQQGLLTSKGADKKDHTFSLAEMKASGDRLTPTSDDVQMQLAFMNMKGINMGSANLSDETLTQKYNGSAPGSDLYNKYLPGLKSRSAAYTAAKNAKGK